jgi:hypothetical protein
MANLLTQGASNHIGCMRFIKSDLCQNCNCETEFKNCDKLQLLTRIFCNDCTFVTDSIECYELRDLSGTKIDIMKNN